MAAALAPPQAIGTSPLTLRTLGPDDVSALRLPGQRNGRELRQALERYPGRSVWNPATLEYALLGAWRNRPEIACLSELVAIRNAEPLLRAAFERCVSHGDELMLAIELETERSPSRFERAGLEMLEEVITYEAPIPRSQATRRRGMRLVPVGLDDGREIDLIARIDEAAFPWLWRNNRIEFDVYLRTPGVKLSLVQSDDNAIGYIGMTLYSGWGHLDRIAISPDAQGQGLGRDALGLAVDVLRNEGAKRAALSTQRTNWRSRRLYERFGFRRTYEHDYRLFGRWRDPQSLVATQTGSHRQR